MYIDPFWAGVLVTIGSELLLLFIAAGISAGTKGKRR